MNIIKGIKKGIIGVDQDDVLAELIPKWLKYYNKEYNDNLTVNDIKSWNIHQYAKPECGEKIYDILSIHKFYRDLDVVENSQRVLEKLSEDYDIFVITDAMATRMSFKAKFDWLGEHFPFINKKNYVFTGNKSIFAGDYLIDDGVHNLEVFKGKGLLFDRPHNRNCDKFERVNGWLGVEKYFESIK